MIGIGGDQLFGGGDEGGHAGFHVDRAAAVQHAVTLGRQERVGVPLVERARPRYHVGVAGQADQRPSAAVTCPQVGDAVGIEVLEGGSRAAPAGR